SRLDEQGLRPGAAEALRERLPTGGGVTDAEAFGDGPGNSPLLEVSGGGSARLRQLGGVEPLRRGDRAEELLALLVARAARCAQLREHVVVDAEIRRAHAPLSMSSRDSCHPERSEGSLGPADLGMTAGDHASSTIVAPLPPSRGSAARSRDTARCFRR